MALRATASESPISPRAQTNLRRPPLSAECLEAIESRPLSSRDREVPGARIHYGKTCSGLLFDLARDARSNPMDYAEADALAFTSFPKEHRAKPDSTTLLERLNGEIKRCTEVVEMFPSEDDIVRLVGALLLKQNDE